jgi:hypothetical protein
MPNHLSILGIIHTAISIIAVFTAVVALMRAGKIDPKSSAGKLYITLTVITCLTGLPIMKTGHPSPGHALGIMILILLPIAIYAHSIRFFGKKAGYIQMIAMSTTLFFSMIPAVNETLTRLPLSHPYASGPDDPKVKMGLLVVFVFYLSGVFYQVLKLKAMRRLYPNIV